MANGQITENFDASGSSSPAGAITAYNWQFGDGGTSNLVAPSHIYAVEDSYLVRLTVTDVRGNSSTISQTVDVFGSTVAGFAIVSVAGLAVNVTPVDQSFGHIVSLSWDWGDSNTDIVTANGPNDFVPAFHIYSGTGTYTITLTVTDSNGGMDSVAHNVSVTAPAGSPPPHPTIDSINPSSTSVVLTWHDTQSVTNFQLLFSPLPSGGQPALQGGGSTGGTFSGLTAGTAYTVQLRASNANGWSAWSGLYSFTEDGPGPPPPPGGNATALDPVLGLCAAASTSHAATIQGRPTGCKLRRIDCNWWTNQPSNSGNAPAGQNDTVDFTNLNAIVSAAQSAGNNLIMMVAYTPPWAGGNGTDGHQYPTSLRDYANFVYLAAKRCETAYPGIVVAWEIWNEPNSSFLAPASATSYAAMLDAAFQAVRHGVVAGRGNRTAVDSSVCVIGGGTAPTAGTLRSKTFWNTVISLVPNSFDHVSVHAYSGGCPANTVVDWNPWSGDIPPIRVSLDAAGRTDSQIVLTEQGYFTRLDSTATNTNDPANCNSYGIGGDAAHEVTVTTAASRLTSLVAKWRSMIGSHKLGPLLYYQQDDTGTVWANHAGLYGQSSTYNAVAKTNTNGVPVLLNAFLAALGSGPGPPPPPPPPGSISFPLFLSFGAGMPSIPATKGSASIADIDGIVTSGAEGLRFGIDWDAANPSHDGSTLNASYMSRIQAVIQYANGKTLWNGTTGLKICLQMALGSTYGSGGGGTGSTKSGQGFNQASTAGGGVVNVPKKFAEFGAAVVNYFKPSANHGTIWGFELGNEMNHSKWDDPALGSGVTATQKGKAYLKCMAHFYRGGKAAWPGSRLIIGGLGGHRDSPADVPAEVFTQDCYNASLTTGEDYDGIAIAASSGNTGGGIHNYFDMWNCHPYCYFAKPTADIAAYDANPSNGRGWAMMLRQIYPILLRYGDHTKGVLVTEFGQPTPDTTGTPSGYQAAADALEDACLNQWNKYAWGGGGGFPLCWFTWQDKYPDVKNSPYGIVRGDPGNEYVHKGVLYDKFFALARKHA